MRIYAKEVGDSNISLCPTFTFCYRCSTLKKHQTHMLLHRCGPNIKKARRLYAVAPLRIDNIMHCSDLSYNTELCSIYELNDVAYLFSIRYLFFHLNNGVEH